jgi:hypothetical protein
MYKSAIYSPWEHFEPAVPRPKSGTRPREVARYLGEINDGHSLSLTDKDVRSYAARVGADPSETAKAFRTLRGVVPAVLYKPPYRPVGTTADSEVVPRRCPSSTGRLLRDREEPTLGRDQSLSCKVSTCPSCGPRGREMRADHWLSVSAGEELHAQVTSEAEWNRSLRKSLDRSDHCYFRVPLQDGVEIIITTAPIGGLVEHPREYFAAVLKFADDGRISACRCWQGTGWEGSGRWQMEGQSDLCERERIKIYIDEGCEPRRNASRRLPPGVELCHDVVLPLQDTPDMNRLRSRLRMSSRGSTGPQEGGW